MDTTSTGQVACLIMLLVHRCGSTSKGVLSTIAHICRGIADDIALALNVWSSLGYFLVVFKLLWGILRLSMDGIWTLLLVHHLFCISRILSLLLVCHIHYVVQFLGYLVKRLRWLHLHSNFVVWILGLISLSRILSLGRNCLLSCILGLLVGLKRKMDRRFFGFSRLVKKELPLTKLTLMWCTSCWLNWEL